LSRSFLAVIPPLPPIRWADQMGADGLFVPPVTISPVTEGKRQKANGRFGKGTRGPGGGRQWPPNSDPVPWPVSVKAFLPRGNGLRARAGR